MDFLIAFLQLLLLIGLGAGALLVRSYLPGYATEKGKNLATKQDIATITREIDGIHSEYEQANDRLRTALRATQFVAETRFSKLHERRAEALDGLYKRLWRAYWAFLPLAGGFGTADDKTPDERMTDASRAGTALLTYFNAHRVYFPADVRAAVDSLQSRLTHAWTTFAFDTRDEARDAPFDERKRHLAAWGEARDIVRNQVPALIDEIEVKIRRALGDDESPGSQAALPQ